MGIKLRLRNLVRNFVIGDREDTSNTAVPSFKDVEIQNGCIISPDTFIGQYTYIAFSVKITKATIGRYCSIASDVSIGDGEHYLHDISTSSLFYQDAYKKLTEKDCIIGNDVWIGSKSIIRRGVRIGDGAVVGANTFVNKDVPDFAVVVGSPARILKYRFDEETIKIIKQARWWDMSIDDARIKLKMIDAIVKEKK